MPSVAVVGAGVTGLACAAALARAGTRVRLLDRLPVVGGVQGWEDARVRSLRAAAEAEGVELLLGVTAARWDGRTLVGVGPGGVERLGADALVVASGARPRSRAELGIAGLRPAGVVPATVACHLAENGLPVGRRPLVVGGGDWADRSLGRLLAAGVERVSVLAPDGVHRPLRGAHEVVEGLPPTAVEGDLRVTGLHAGGRLFRCDAVVLAHGLEALRNVDGAVCDGERTVYAQPLEDPGSVARAEAAGAAAAAAALALASRARVAA